MCAREERGKYHAAVVHLRRENSAGRLRELCQHADHTQPADPQGAAGL